MDTKSILLGIILGAGSVAGYDIAAQVDSDYAIEVGSGQHDMNDAQIEAVRAFYQSNFSAADGDQIHEQKPDASGLMSLKFDLSNKKFVARGFKGITAEEIPAAGARVFKPSALKAEIEAAQSVELVK